MRYVLALSTAGAVCAVLGGVLYWAAHGGSSLSRSVAFGFWVAAAVVLVAAVVAGRRIVWRRTNLQVVEGWIFVTSAVVLTAAGAAIDAIGS